MAKYRQNEILCVFFVSLKTQGNTGKNYRGTRDLAGKNAARQAGTALGNW